jgi:3'-5' exoribonuclease
VIPLGELRAGQEAVCFAVLLRKDPGDTGRRQPALRCQFGDRTARLDAPIWATSPILAEARAWEQGQAYRLRVKAEDRKPYGIQLWIHDARPATEADAEEGYEPARLVETSEFDPRERLERIREHVGKQISDEKLRRLVLELLETHAEALVPLPAAKNIHHATRGGFLEHVASVTRLAVTIAKHYEQYYGDRFPVISRDVLIAGAVLHDIWKVHELEQRGLATEYSIKGKLVGHIVMGRDMVREAASRIEGFPEEVLLRLEHAILAHHGKTEFGAPVLPMTLEAFVLSRIDDLDAKVNAIVEASAKRIPGQPFTDKVYALDNVGYFFGPGSGEVEATGSDEVETAVKP